MPEEIQAKPLKVDTRKKISKMREISRKREASPLQEEMPHVKSKSRTFSDADDTEDQVQRKKRKPSGNKRAPRSFTTQLRKRLKSWRQSQKRKKTVDTSDIPRKKRKQVGGLQSRWITLY
jgi:hypothetical protein